MKQLKKQLAAAIIMTLVAAISLGSSTYAWFANNTTADATGMSVNVKSDVGFMLISAGHKTVKEIQDAAETSATAATPTDSLYPVAHTSSIATTSQLNNYIKVLDDKGTWYYGYSKSASVSTMDTTTKKTLAASNSNIDDYVLINEFSICAASGSNAMNNLKVKQIKIGSTGNQAVKVLVVSETAYEEFNSEHSQPDSGSVILGDVSPNYVTPIKVYVYWDGNDSDVTTNNKSNLLNTSVYIEFEATPY